MEMIATGEIGDMEPGEPFDLFLEAQNHARCMLEESASESDRMYWQGVKDGLRKAYAIFANEPEWAAVGALSPQGRPDESR